MADGIDIPETITCVDCGQTAHRLTPPPEDGWEVGDFVAYRCSGCRDRWDLVVADPESGGSSDTESAFDLRQWLSERNRSDNSGN